MTIRLFSTIAVLLTVSLVGCSDDSDVLAPPTDTISTPAEFSALMQEIAADTEVPGFAVSIVKDNMLLYQEAFGYADVASKTPYTNQTVQHIASISKTFVGAAVVKAIEQGHFTLETDINDLLPVTLVNPKQPGASIKIKHLVTHTSGLLDEPGTYLQENYYILPGEDMGTPGAELLTDGLGIDQRQGRDLDEFLAEYYLDDGDLYSLDNFAATAPGTAWAYSNVATGLTGYLIEAATGQSFADYVKAHVLAPLGMNASTYDIRDVNLAKVATWYYDKSTPYPRYANDSYPEGSIFTTNTDLGKYLLDMMQGAQGQGGALFGDAGYNLLFADHLASGVVPADFADNQGIFWYRKEGIYQHGGNSFGVSTHLQLDTDGKAGYALITNMDATFDQTEYNKVARLIDQAVQRFLDAN